MLSFAQGNETYSQYLAAMKPVLIVLCLFYGITVVLFFSSWCYAFKRTCCTSCKLDLTRTDYRKHEKLRPGFYFVIFNLFGFCLIGLGLFQFTNMWFYLASTFCQSMSFLTAMETQLVISLAYYDYMVRLLEQVFEPILYTNLVFIALLILCYLFGLIVICCVMVTKQRRYKNISHIAWISGVTTLLVASSIGCVAVFGGLQIWDACQVYEYSQQQHSVTGLVNFYPAAVQPLLNTCVYGTAQTSSLLINKLQVVRSLQTAAECTVVNTAYTKMWTSICGTTLKSIAEVTILMALLIPIACGAAFSGLMFVNRNKVDIPVPDGKPDAKVKPKAIKSAPQPATNIQDFSDDASSSQ